MKKEYLPSFARRIGKSISNNKRALISEFLPTISPQNLEFSSLHKKIHLEIGFGSGEFLYNIAKSNLNEVFIGCEPYLNGVGNLLEKIYEDKLNNIFIWQDDARELLENIPDKTLSTVYILFPDPWPKAKHNKRRLINDYLIKKISDKLVHGGKAFIATDDANYAEWVLFHFSKYPQFSWQALEDFYHPFRGYEETHYHKKSVSIYKRKPYFFGFTLSKS